MAINFNVKDVLEVAMQIQRNGRDFFRAAALKAGDPDARQVFLNLATRTEEYLKVLSDMVEKLSAKEKTPTAFDPDNQEGQFLKSMADGNVLVRQANPLEKLRGNESFEETIEIAISFEMDSISFYRRIIKFVRGPQSRKKIENIIDEEKKQIALLSEWLS